MPPPLFGFSLDFVCLLGVTRCVCCITYTIFYLLFNTHATTHYISGRVGHKTTSALNSNDVFAQVLNELLERLPLNWEVIAQFKVGGTACDISQKKC